MSGDWRKVSVGSMFAMKVREPEFNPQNPCKAVGVVRAACNSVLRSQRKGYGLEDCWAASLAFLVQ